MPSMDHGASSEKTVMAAHLKSLIQDLHSLEVMVEDFDLPNQSVLFDKLNSYVKSLKKTDELSGSMSSIEIPVEILK
jgi:hypothetical protein